MALTVEDGTGKANAESYISVSDANTYFTNRGVSTWVGADAVKEAALRKGTDYIDAKYGDRLKGYRKSSTQALKWPRAMVPLEDVPMGSEEYIADTVIPADLKAATCEAALRALTSDLTPDLERGGGVQSISVAGAISKTYAAWAPAGTTYPIIDRLMRDFVSSKNSVELARS